MSLFNQTFFKFAFGFVGIISLSVLAIFIVGAMSTGEQSTTTTVCVEDCAEQSSVDISE